jgi:hypothetical protein
MSPENTGQGTGQGAAGQGTDPNNTGQGATGNAEEMVARSELTAVVEERNKLKARAQELQKSALKEEELAEYRSLKEAQSKAKLASKQAEDERLAQEGKFQELLDRQKAEADAEKSVLTKKNADLQAVLTEKIADEQILRAATGKAADPKKVVRILKQNALVEYDENNKPSVRVIDDDGKPVFDDNGKPASLTWYVEDYLKNNPDLQPASGNTGAGGAGSARAHMKGKVTAADFAAVRSYADVLELEKKSKQ